MPQWARCAMGDERKTAGVPCHTSSSSPNQTSVAKPPPVQRRHMPQ
jgi:hypothetical protein